MERESRGSGSSVVASSDRIFDYAVSLNRPDRVAGLGEENSRSVQLRHPSLVGLASNSLTSVALGSSCSFWRSTNSTFAVGVSNLADFWGSIEVRDFKILTGGGFVAKKVDLESLSF